MYPESKKSQGGPGAEHRAEAGQSTELEQVRTGEEGRRQKRQDGPACSQEGAACPFLLLSLFYRKGVRKENQSAPKVPFT